MSLRSATMCPTPPCNYAVGELGSLLHNGAAFKLSDPVQTGNLRLCQRRKDIVT